MRIESHLRVDRDVLFVTTSYGISLVRLVIAFMGAITILRGDTGGQFAVASIALVMALDYLDGAMFERSHFSTIKEWRINRRIVDSVFDRLVIQIICIPLLIEDSSFIWLYAPILAREVAISGYLTREFARGFLVYPRNVSKIACALVGVAVIGFMVLPLSVTLIIALLMLTLSMFALFDYRHRVGEYKMSKNLAAHSIGRPEEII